MLRFPLIFGVILIHYGITMRLPQDDPGFVSFGSVFLFNLIANVLARISVPVFFMISGFLFFQGFSADLKIYREKIKKRVKSLFVPYMIWNSLTLLAFFMAQSMNEFSEYISGRFKPIIDYTAYDYLNAFAGLESNPISYQFWFIRDLMLLAILSPIMWFIMTKAPRIGLLAIFAIFILDPAQVKYLNLSYTALMFFSLGAFWALHSVDLGWVDRRGRLIVLGYGAMALATAFFFSIEEPNAKYMVNLSFLPGILAAWYLAGIAARKANASLVLMWLSVFSFFVFAVHEPTLTVIRKVTYGLLEPSHPVAILGLFMILPTLIAVLAVLAGYGLKRLTPRVYDVMTGAR